MKTKPHYSLLACLLLVCSTSLAQVPGGGSPGGVSVALSKLFAPVTAFSAKAEAQVLDKEQKEIVRLPMDFALLDNKIRVEVDMTRMKSQTMPESAMANLKEIGMSQVISVIRPDQKLIYVIYPHAKAYVTMPLAKEDIDAAQKTPKTQKTALGNEVIDGHACVKNKVVVSDDKATMLEATTWNATDLKDFPIQILTVEKDNTTVLRYKQVQMASPDAKQFEPPAGYTKYADTMELMQGIVTKKGPNPGRKQKISPGFRTAQHPTGVGQLPPGSR